MIQLITVGARAGNKISKGLAAEQAGKSMEKPVGRSRAGVIEAESKNPRKGSGASEKSIEESLGERKCNETHQGRSKARVW